MPVKLLFFCTYFISAVISFAPFLCLFASGFLRAECLHLEVFGVKCACFDIGTTGNNCMVTDR